MQQVTDMRTFAVSLHQQVQALPSATYDSLVRGGEWTVIALESLGSLDHWADDAQRRDAEDLLAAGEFGTRLGEWARSLIESIPLAA